MRIVNGIGRQAVIVVHGMGEQRPMDTLRDFVKGVKSKLEENNAREKDSTIRSKPDSVGDIYETARLSMDSIDGRPITDFYEFYWAHNMRDTKVSQLLVWLKKVVFKWVTKVPPRLRPVWITAWSLILLSMIGTLIFFKFTDPTWLKKIGTALGAGALTTFILTSIGAFIKSSILKSLGDVARYLTPIPDNIAERSHIRQQGIQFLEKLHTLQDITQVDRIIIVAHSLGTVVAYDLIRLLWTKYNESSSKPSIAQPPALVAVSNFAAAPSTIDQSDHQNFQDAQQACWREQRGLGNPWLVTDFVTLGAALNAAEYFMQTNTDIQELIEQREMPVCPPVTDPPKNVIYYPHMLPLQPPAKRRKSVQVLHHGAPFGVIRWTNIFYTSDFVGGAMQRIFGQGIRDVPIERSSPWFYPGGHTAYWDKDDKNNALDKIVEAMKLYP